MRLSCGMLLLAVVACGGDSKQPDAGVGGDAGSDAAQPDTPPMPLPPAAMDGAIALEVGATATGMMQASDPNGDALTFSIVTQPTKGTLTFDATTGAFTYVATTLVAGTDIFTFQVSDGTANAPTPGTIAVTLQPVLFTGYWQLTNVQDNGAACSDASFRFGHATAQNPDPGYFAVSQRTIRCGSTTWNLTAAQQNITSTNVTDAVVNFSRAQYVSGCGTVTDTFRLERKLTGFEFTETTSTPCFGIGTHVITATATRTEIAYLFVNPTAIAFGNAYQGDPVASRTVTLRNVGRVAAASFAVAAPTAPFIFEGGTYPGTTGTCGAQLAGLASCTLALSMSTAALTDTISAGWSATFLDGLGTNVVSGSLSGAVIPRLTNPTAVTAGFRFQCALASGSVVCWGDNSQGQTTVPSLVNPRKISAGWQHACALDDTGVHCWGRNTEGQCSVPALQNPSAISAGTTHTCALDDTGVHCWGSNGWGQTTIPTLTNPQLVSAGGNHTCALHDGGVACWGLSSAGQTTVPALVAPTSVSAGGSHTCALDANGVHCWGASTYGKTTVPTLTNPTAVSAGGDLTCAIANNAVACWGMNSSSTPSISATAIAAGSDHACAITQGSVRCWGGVTYP